MARTTKLQCSHCDFSKETSDEIPPGKSIACPRCRLPLEIIRPAGAVEEEKVPSFTDDLEPVLSARSARTKVAQKRALVSNKPPPFHQSRSFIAAVSVTAITFVVLVLFILYRDTIGQLNRGMKDIRVKRENRVVNDLRSKPLKPKVELARPVSSVDDDGATGSATKPPTTSIAKAKTKEDQGPVVAPAEAKIGDLVVNVKSAMLAKVYHDRGDQCLLVKIVIKNQSKKPYTFWSWSQPESRVVLVDSRGKQYQRLATLVPDAALIEPDQMVIDSVAFEETPFREQLELELELAGHALPIRFRIPGSMITRSMGAAFANAQPPPAIAGAAPPQPPPQAPGLGIGQPLRQPPKEDPLSREVNEGYNEGVSKLQARTRGKSGNEAVNLMRRGKADLLKKLAEKHSLSIDELRKMINEP